MKNVNVLKLACLCFVVGLLSSCDDSSDPSTSMYGSTKNSMDNAYSLVLQKYNIKEEDIIYFDNEQLWNKEYLISIFTNDDEQHFTVDLLHHEIKEESINDEFEKASISFTSSDAYLKALEYSKLKDNEILKSFISKKSSDNALALEVILYTANIKYYYLFDNVGGNLLDFAIDVVDFDNSKSVYISSEEAIKKATSYLDDDALIFNNVKADKERGNKIYIVDFINEDMLYKISINAINNEIIKDERINILNNEIFQNNDLLTSTKVKEIISNNIKSSDIEYNYIHPGMDKTKYIWHVSCNYNSYLYNYEINANDGDIICKEKYHNSYNDFLQNAYNNDDKSFDALQILANKYGNLNISYSFIDVLKEEDILSIIKENEELNTNFIITKLIYDNDFYYYIYGNDDESLFWYQVNAYNGNIIKQKNVIISDLLALTKSKLGFSDLSKITYEIDYKMEQNDIYYYLYGACECYSYVIKICDSTKEYEIIEKKCDESSQRRIISKTKAITKALNACLFTTNEVISINVRINDYKIHNAYIVNFRKLDAYYSVEVDIYSGKILSHSTKYLI